ncbi:Fis family transcriptional regulator, partial [Acinetobacter baumannii]
VPLHIPPLRERREDIVPLARHFLAELNAAEGTDKVFSASALERLCQYGWPGNVRELRNVAERTVLGIEAGSPPFGQPAGTTGQDAAPRPLSAAVEAFERALIADALRRH